jgi:hypothetical protein
MSNFTPFFFPCTSRKENKDIHKYEYEDNEEHKKSMQRAGRKKKE